MNRLSRWIKRFLKNNYNRFIFLLRNRNVHHSIELSGVNHISLGTKCCIGPHSKLLCKSIYLSTSEPQILYPNLRIGNNFHATRNLVIQCGGDLLIGDNVLIASDVFIINYNHGTSPKTNNYLDNELIVKKVVIEDGVWIGNDVIILPGVKIGTKSIIAAGSIVTKDIPPYSMAAGNPAKVIKKWNCNSEQWIPINNKMMFTK